MEDKPEISPQEKPQVTQVTKVESESTQRINPLKKLLNLLRREGAPAGENRQGRLNGALAARQKMMEESNTSSSRESDINAKMIGVFVALRLNDKFGGNLRDRLQTKSK